MKIKVSLLLVIFCILIGSCSKKQKTYRVGLSQCTIADDWRKNMCDEMKREIGFYPDLKIQLIIKDAQNNSDKQIADIMELYEAGVDLIVVSPNEAEGLTPVLSELHDKRIPIVIVDRKINTENYTAYIGGDNSSIGETAGKYALNSLKKQSTILEIKGLKGSTPAEERSKGFRKILKRNSLEERLTSITGNWSDSLSEVKTDSILNTGYIPTHIFAHNDPMAAGARRACQRHKINPTILGIDGLPTKGGGVDMVLNSQIDATFLYPSGGDKVVQTAIKILQNEKFEKTTILKTFSIDKNNASSLKIQYQTLVDQQAKIEKQRARIGIMMELINNQKLFLLIAGIVIAIMISFILLILALFKQKQKANKLITKQKEHITLQMEKLKEYSEKLGQQNSILNQQNEEIKTQNEAILSQKNQIQLQNEHILSGIRCAQTLQNSLVNNYREIKKSFDCFVYYKPKDIVSGDFYWYKKITKDKIPSHLILMADCTGHGVSGAMMTMLGVKIISEIVEIEQITNPQEILNMLEKNIQNMYHNEEVSGILGMDIIICLLQKTNDSPESDYNLVFSGAKNPLYIYENGTFSKLNGSKKSIGVQHKSQNLKIFETETIRVSAGTTLYFTTDGFIDQNNHERARFGSARFEDLLKKAAPLELEQQLGIFDETLTEFQGLESQRDDISLLGIQL